MSAINNFTVGKLTFCLLPYMFILNVKSIFFNYILQQKIDVTLSTDLLSLLFCDYLLGVKTLGLQKKIIM